MPLSLNSRNSHHDIHPQFLERWSPRAFTREEIPEPVLLSFLEAARWAPSAGNGQPWRFVYARRGTAHWDAALGLLAPSNQAWAKDASALIFIVSDTQRARPTGELVPNPGHAFDTGAAWGYLALQAHHAGWAAHGMGGFDRERSYEVLGVDKARYEVMAAIAVGRTGAPELLPDDLRVRETPSGRTPIAEVAFEGRFSG